MLRYFSLAKSRRHSAHVNVRAVDDDAAPPSPAPASPVDGESNVVGRASEDLSAGPLSVGVVETTAPEATLSATHTVTPAPPLTDLVGHDASPFGDAAATIALPPVLAESSPVPDASLAGAAAGAPTTAPGVHTAAAALPSPPPPPPPDGNTTAGAPLPVDVPTAQNRGIAV